MNLDSLRGWFRGEHCAVVAPGPSALTMPADFYLSHWTFGCNRAVAFCRPDFAVCIEPQHDGAWPIIEAARATFVFSHIERVPRTIRVDAEVSRWLPVSGGPLFLGMSPFFGAAVAIALGFSRVGLVGVDLDGDDYADRRFRAECAEAWERLNQTANREGVDLCNLNPKSRLEPVVKVPPLALAPKH